MKPKKPPPKKMPLDVAEAHRTLSAAIVRNDQLDIHENRIRLRAAYAKHDIPCDSYFIGRTDYSLAAHLFQDDWKAANKIIEKVGMPTLYFDIVAPAPGKFLPVVALSPSEEPYSHPLAEKGLWVVKRAL